MKQAHWTVMLALVVGLGGCTKGTKIADTWKDPSTAPKPMGKIVVVALTDDAVTKRMFEDHFAAALRDRGNEAVASYTFVDAGPETNPDSLVSSLRTAGYGAAVTARPLGEDIKDTQTWGSGYFIPSAYYHWGSYYGMSYQAVTATSYNERSSVLYVEANLFDLASERLVWAARSGTTKTGKLKEGVDSYTRAVVKELAKSHWIK